MSELNSHDGFVSPVPSHRLDVPIHKLLNQSAPRPAVRRTSEGMLLPEPVFPQHPELIHDLDEADIAAHQTVLTTGKREWLRCFELRARGWSLLLSICRCKFLISLPILENRGHLRYKTSPHLRIDARTGPRSRSREPIFAFFFAYDCPLAYRQRRS